MPPGKTFCAKMADLDVQLASICLSAHQNVGLSSISLPCNPWQGFKLRLRNVQMSMRLRKIWKEARGPIC